MRVYVLVCAILLRASPSAAQPGESSSQSFGDDIALYMKLSGHTFTAPLRWKGNDWVAAGSIVGGTLASGWLDDEFYNTANRNRTRGNDDLERAFKQFGNGLTGIGLSGALYGSGVAFQNRWLRETGILMASSLTVSAVTQTALKSLFGRARPYVNTGNGDFKPFRFKTDYVSFPSGHTIVSFTIAAVLAERIDNIYVTIGLYSAATLGGMSRIYSRNHWFSDIVFGGALAIVVSHSVVSWFESGMMEDDGSAGLRIVPRLNGVSVVWRF